MGDDTGIPTESQLPVGCESSPKLLERFSLHSCCQVSSHLDTKVPVCSLPRGKCLRPQCSLTFSLMSSAGFYPALMSGWSRLSQFPTHSCAVCCVYAVAQSCPTLRSHGLQPTRLPCPWGFSRQECWSGLPCPPPGDFPGPGVEPRSHALQADSLPAEPTGKPKNTGVGSLSLAQKSNWGLWHCRQILYQLSYQGRPCIASI